MPGVQHGKSSVGKGIAVSIRSKSAAESLSIGLKSENSSFVFDIGNPAFCFIQYILPEKPKNCKKSILIPKRSEDRFF